MKQLLISLIVFPLSAFPLSAFADLIPTANAQTQISRDKPNIIIFLTDDQRYDDLMPFMPQTYSRIFQQGTTFNKAYVTTPICCPSRATILTGKYASQHKVLANHHPLKRKTFVSDLKAGGYKTALVGKYLNSWDGTPRKEYDFWASWGKGRHYINPKMNVNGIWARHEGYSTEILQNYALEFIEQSQKSTSPFFLLFSFNAPHPPALLPENHKPRFADIPIVRFDSFNQKNLTDRPKYFSSFPIMSEERIKILDGLRDRQRETLGLVDDAVGKVIDLLEKQKKLDNTVIFFLSDNGFLFGEHRLGGKGLLYEPAIHVPFAVRYPAVFMKVKSTKLVASLDIAPTIYELASIKPTIKLSGLSLLQLFPKQGQKNKSWRRNIFLEAPRSKSFPSWVGVHTGRYVYIQMLRGNLPFLPELYDLKKDPYQLRNLVGRGGSGNQKLAQSMRRQLKRLMRSASFESLRLVKKRKRKKKIVV